ncbi:CatB-related O-acetyltransferase [Faecalibacillus intestinalis]|uniref:CatB-related O-acetyltransferase n=1 Tax=Faecalibacillus intestinalis TaxID=1982626 RepID=UPI003AB58C98
MNLLKSIYNVVVKEMWKKFKFIFFKVKWRKNNSYNETIPMNFFDMNEVSVGRATYGELNIAKFNKNSKLKIGSFCSIGQNVSFILDADHQLNSITTFPMKVKIAQISKFEALSKGDIIVNDDVWIGYGALILSGVTIGQGAVVAAGSVVISDVPPYAIVCGVPAKVIKYRFTQEIIDELMKIDYDKLKKEDIEQNIELFYSDLKNKKQLEWLPKK